MKRRRPLARVTAITDNSPGVVSSPTSYRFPIVDTYYRITRTTTAYAREGQTTVTHSWWCEEDSTFCIATIGPFKSWRDAMKYAQLCIHWSAKAKAAAK